MERITGHVGQALEARLAHFVPVGSPAVSLRDHLRRYWFRWEEPQNGGWLSLSSVGAGLGCGVTGVDVQDAEDLIRTALLAGGPLPPVAEVVEDVDVRTVDAGHVLPNMGDPSVRGVRYPRA
jgi:hypothetical protein